MLRTYARRGDITIRGAETSRTGRVAKRKIRHAPGALGARRLCFCAYEAGHLPPGATPTLTVRRLRLPLRFRRLVGH